MVAEYIFQTYQWEYNAIGIAYMFAIIIQNYTNSHIRYILTRLYNLTAREYNLNL